MPSQTIFNKNQKHDFEQQNRALRKPNTKDMILLGEKMK